MGFALTTAHANPLTLDASLASANAELDTATAREIVAWALALAERPVLTTSFRPGAAALVHLVTRQRPDIPVVWVDTGYNTPATCRHVAALSAAWRLNLHRYAPRMPASHRAAHAGGPPAVTDPGFLRFVRDIRLEPLERAFNALKPDVWLGSPRAGRGVVSRGTHHTLHVAPLQRWSTRDVAAYRALHGIPDYREYFDPTRAGAAATHGLQLSS